MQIKMSHERLGEVVSQFSSYGIMLEVIDRNETSQHNHASNEADTHDDVM